MAAGTLRVDAGSRRAQRCLRRRLRGRAGPRRRRRGAAPPRRPVAVGDLRRQRRRRRAAGLGDHAPRRASAALAADPAVPRHRVLRRADDVLDAAGRAAAHAGRPGGRVRRGHARRGSRGGRAGHRAGAPVIWVAVALLGGAGAVGRLLVDGAGSARTSGAFPVGTLAVNVSGAFALGLLHRATGDALLLAGTATLGSYTTFSTWMLESQRLGEDGETRALAANLAVSLAAGLVAAALGRAL